MYAILKRTGKIDDEDRDVQRNTQSWKILLTNDEKDEVLINDPTFQAADEKFAACWMEWRAFYSDEEQGPNMRKQQAVIKSGLRPEFNTDDEEVR